jgi:hypothetical protein
MTTAQQIVNNLNDNQAIMMVNKIHNRIFSAVDFDTIENNVKGDDDGSTLLGLSDDQLGAELDAGVSVAVARKFLESVAQDEGLSEVITDSWEEVQNDDSMFVGTVIAVGLMVNLTLFMISSNIEIDLGKVKISKGTVDTEAVKAIMEPISKAASLASTG